MEALTLFTQRALSDSWQSWYLLNTEMSLVRKTVPPNRMALDIIPALQGGTGAIIQRQCCVLTPEESANASSFLNRMSTQVNT